MNKSELIPGRVPARIREVVRCSRRFFALQNESPDRVARVQEKVEFRVLTTREASSSDLPRATAGPCVKRNNIIINYRTALPRGGRGEEGTETSPSETRFITRPRRNARRGRHALRRKYFTRRPGDRGRVRVAT